MNLNRTYLSLYYLAGYLIPVGLSLMFFPMQLIKLLFSNRTYDDMFPRLVGVLLLSLGIIIVQIIRLKLEVLYPTTLIVRSIITPTLFAVYLYSGDPLFLVMTGVLAFGLVLTGTCYFLDRRDKAAGGGARAAGR
ncbi:MAG TPA: hypothetical protein VL285_02275 [Bryobacteraceae bacterium]|nr:hypothetical protein [Bryobacteraceae bacterium]